MTIVYDGGLLVGFQIETRGVYDDHETVAAWIVPGSWLVGQEYKCDCERRRVSLGRGIAAKVFRLAVVAEDRKDVAWKTL